MMKKILSALFIGLTVAIGSAQNSAPAPGTGSITPPAGTPSWGGIGWNPGPSPSWGSPWNSPGWNNNWNNWNGWNYNPPTTVVVNQPNPNQGKESVVAMGYDDQGVWRSIPMSVYYTYTGSRYSVVVLTAWNPWSDQWEKNLNIPAINTSYRLNGTNYHFYVALPTGTYYFNLGN